MSHPVAARTPRPGRRVSRRGVLVALAAILVLVGGLVAWRGIAPHEQDTFARAVGQTPAETRRVTFVDWAGVREELDADLDPESSTAELADFLSRGFERDLTTTSMLGQSAATLHERFGFSPATVDWETLAQAPDGAVVTLALGPDGDPDQVRARLRRLGFTEPAEVEGVWRGGPGLVAVIGGGLSELFGFVAVLEDGLVLGSDDPAYLSRAVRAAGGGDDGLEAGEVVAAAEDPLAAVYFHGDQACTGLAMSQAAQADQRTAAALVEAAGTITPYAGLVVAAHRDGTLRATFGFASPAQARDNATSRARLAAGPAPGQGGSFADRFRVDAAQPRGSLVRLRMTPTDDRGYAFSDISSGPVLFATC